MYPQVGRIHRFIHSPNRFLNNLSIFPTHPILQGRKCSTQGSSACWKCGTERNHQNELFCVKCQVLQHPIQKDNYFRLLGIEEQFDVDQTFLRNKFRKLQSVIHPDKFVNKTHEEKTISEEYSSLANKAFSSLQPPLKRAEHLLTLKGQVLSESETVDDQEFLMEIMALNEEIEEAYNEEEKLKVLLEKNKKMLQKLLKEISDHFKNNEMDSVKKSIVKLKYFTSISSRLNSIFREMGITE